MHTHTHAHTPTPASCWRLACHLAGGGSRPAQDTKFTVMMEQLLSYFSNRICCYVKVTTLPIDWSPWALISFLGEFSLAIMSLACDPQGSWWITHRHHSLNTFIHRREGKGLLSGNGTWLGWTPGWLTWYLLDWLVGWLIGLLVDWLTECLVVCLCVCEWVTHEHTLVTRGLHSAPF